MKISQNDTENIQSGPKLRNINDQQPDIIEEKPASADFRLKIAVIAIAALTLFIGVKGSITKSSLSSKLEEQEKLLAAAQAEALMYGITEDDEGDVVIPDVDTSSSVSISELDWDSLDERNMELLMGKKTGGGVVERTGFVQLLLNWKGKSGYDNVRQTLMDEWGFTEDSKLLSLFMPPMEEELDANMNLSGNPSVFELSNDGKTKSYFLICTVRNTINGKSATGSVGIRVTINEDGTLSNVTAQTLS